MKFKRAIMPIVVACCLTLGLASPAYAVPQALTYPVEVFDVKKETVVNVLPLTQELHDKFAKLLAASPGMYGGMSMNPKSGYVVRVRFPEPIAVPDRIYPEKVKEIYVFLEERVQIKALVFFQGEKRPIVVTLEDRPEAYIKAVQPEGS